MPRNYSVNWRAVKIKDPRVAVRGVLGALLLANLAAALLVFRPWGGSAEDLERQRQQLNAQVIQLQKKLAQTKALVSKVEQARKTGDQFLGQYTTDRQTTMSMVYAELMNDAKDAGITARPLSIDLEPVEGSDTLMQMTISAAYEGPYAGMIKFVNLLDRSPRFLIIESMTATPQTSGNNLTVTFKLDTFVREQPGSAA